MENQETKQEISQDKETKINDTKPWLFKDGNEGGPGRPTETPEQKLIKKAGKQVIEEYKEKLTEALSKLSPVLIAKALEGDMSAIKEINDRVLGKPHQTGELKVQAEVGPGSLFDKAKELDE